MLLNYREKAMKLAMQNAIDKSKQMLSSMKNRLVLGQLYYSVEDCLKIQSVEEYERVLSSSQFETFNWRKKNKVIRVELTSVFGLEVPKKPRSAV
jgi:hypothetical protein